MSGYISLHTHSDYSPQDGACTVKQIAKQAKKLGMNSVALTDHGRCGGLLKFKKACEENDVKPIYGCEFYCAPESHTLREKIEGHNTSYHLTLLAKNEKGLQNLFRLCSLGWLEGFYYKPRISDTLLEKYKEGILVLSGCASGRISNRILEGKTDEAIEYALKMKALFEKDFYLEAQNHGMDWQLPLKAQIFQLSEKTDIPVVATQDSHFIKEESAPLHQKICKLSAGDLEFGTTEMHFKSRDEMRKRFKKEEWHAIERTVEVAEKCNVDWQHGEYIWPAYNLPGEKKPENQLKIQAWEGMKRLGLSEKSEYEKRFNLEFETIKEMGFPTYFLVVSDFVAWAKKNNVSVGPGRGSASGSLISYCLGITEVDPIKYGLFFSRFLNKHRVSMPDIDVDISPRGRKDVMAYLSNKYGQDKMAQIGTYMQMKPRGSLRDFARVCGYEPAVGDKLASLIPPDVAGKSLTFEEALEAEPKLKKTQWPEVVKLAQEAEGLNTKAGVHAAGVVISNQELKAQVPLFRGRGDEVATQFDMHDVEEIGLVKYDLLGLVNLDVIQDTINHIREIQKKEIDISKIDRKDQEVYEEIFHRGRLEGIFQFETSTGFKDLCMKIKPRSIEDLSIITALYRPGPLGTGLTNEYVNRRRGKPFEYLHPMLEPILKSTFGVLVFQESIMRICTDIAGYNEHDADSVRKAIGKKITEKIEKEQEKFILGCTKNNMPKSVATELFEAIKGFGQYGFNKAHSVAYSEISYRTAWLKHYYPQEFYCSLLNNTIKEQPQLVKYIYACKDDGIPVEPPDVNRSQALFSIDNGTIVFGLGGIKGIGAKACERILGNRPEKGFPSLGALIKAGASAKDIRPLAMSGALESITEHGRTVIVEWASELIAYHKKLRRWTERKEKFERRNKEREEAIQQGKAPPRRLQALPDPPEEPPVPDTKPLTRQERLDLERETLGFYLTGHPLDSYPGLYRIAPNTLEEALEERPKTSSPKFPVVISVMSKKRTKKGKNMAILQIEDKTTRAEATVFPSVWNKHKDQLKEGQVGIITCKAKADRRDESQIQLIFQDFKEAGEGIPMPPEPKDLSFGLQDGSTITFRVSKKTSTDAWQRAIAILKNLGEKV